MFRCPGGKRRIAETIVERIVAQCRDQPIKSYCEPFAATGAVCLALLRDGRCAVEKVWINDIDRGAFALWWCVVNESQKFMDLVDRFKPSRRAFFEFKKELLSGTEFDLPELAFRKIAVHQMSFSGLGVMSGSTMTAVASRWSPKRIRHNVEEAGRLLDGKQVTITNEDFRVVLSQVDRETFVFADPPYMTQGRVLYQHSFSHRDHEELRDLLARAKFRWLLTYDDCSQVRKMYRNDLMTNVNMTYTIHGVFKKNELLITPRQHTRSWPEETFAEGLTCAPPVGPRRENYVLV